MHILFLLDMSFGASAMLLFTTGLCKGCTNMQVRLILAGAVVDGWRPSQLQQGSLQR
jgi:hypothetical protein